MTIDSPMLNVTETPGIGLGDDADAYYREWSAKVDAS